jgi:hypothetical protein
MSLPPEATAAAAVEPPPAAETRPALDEVISKTWVGLWAGYNAHDADRFASYFTDDAAIDVYGLPEMQGRTDLIRSVERVFAVSPDVRVEGVRLFQK